MGQAKQRKTEIEALKASKNKVRFLAIRHLEDGEREFCHGEVEIGKPVNNKNVLLQYICMNDWLHNPPMPEIAEYLIQTNSYNEMKMITKEKELAYVINFFKVDTEMSIRQGSKTYSCRQIWAMSPEKVKQYASELAKELRENSEYSVKEYA